jgi:hypothetical protein
MSPINSDQAIAIWEQANEFFGSIASLTSTPIDDYAVEASKFALDNDRIREWVLGFLNIPQSGFAIVQLPQPIVQEFLGGRIGDAARDRFIQFLLPIIIEMIQKWLAGQGFQLSRDTIPAEPVA